MKLLLTFIFSILASICIHAQTADRTAYERYISTQFYFQSVDGHIIFLDGKKQNVKIKYEAPISFQDDTKPLIVMKKEKKEKAYLKSALKAFYVDGHYFIPEDLGDSVIWVMLANEGAIRETIYFQPNTYQGTPSYYNIVRLFTNQETHEGHFVSKLAIGFNKVMSGMTKSHEELSEKVKQKQSGYRFINYKKIIAEYNLWYDQTYPDKISYLNEKPDFAALIARFSPKPK